MHQQGLQYLDIQTVVFKADEKDGYPWTQAYGLCVTPYGDVLIALVPMVHLKPEEANNSYGTMDVQMAVQPRR